MPPPLVIALLRCTRINGVCFSVGYEHFLKIVCKRTRFSKQALLHFYSVDMRLKIKYYSFVFALSFLSQIDSIFLTDSRKGFLVIKGESLDRKEYKYL